MKAGRWWRHISCWRSSPFMTSRADRLGPLALTVATLAATVAGALFVALGGGSSHKTPARRVVLVAEAPDPLASKSYPDPAGAVSHARAAAPAVAAAAAAPGAPEPPAGQAGARPRAPDPTRPDGQRRRRRLHRSNHRRLRARECDPVEDQPGDRGRQRDRRLPLCVRGRPRVVHRARLRLLGLGQLRTGGRRPDRRPRPRASSSTGVRRDRAAT